MNATERRKDYYRNADVRAPNKSRRVHFHLNLFREE
jgi:hypothetical protein